MARSVSRGSIGADGTRFGDGEVGSDRAAARPPHESDGELGVGSVIDGKYRLEGLLGEGGMGTVWRAQHLQLDLPVAIKLLRAGGDQLMLSERLKIEARASAQLVHPAIVRVFDIDESERGEPYIVMELLRGESLSDLLDRGRLPGESAVQTLLPIAEALALAHSRGIVHRDLKPHNVFLVEEPDRIQPKLLDFGIAKLMDQERNGGSLTETGNSVGSPDYMSPEQARGSNDVDYRADIWSLSVMLFEAVTTETPFHGSNYNALMRAIVENEPRPLGAHVDPKLADLIFWGLSKERDERPKSVQELGRELARWLLGRGVTEDVCGASLESRWIARSPLKSVPLLVEPVEVPKPQAARTGTLVSARLSHESGVQPASAANVAVAAGSLPTEHVSRRPWAWAVAALALAGGIAWAVLGRGGSSANVSPVATSPLASGLHGATLDPAPRSSVAPVPIEIASSAPAPLGSATPGPSAVPTRDDVHSVAPGPSRALKSGPKSAASAKPAVPGPRRRDDHDETHELLQAY